MQRRKFIKDTCFSCAALTAGIASLQLLSSCNGPQRFIIKNSGKSYQLSRSAFAENNLVILQRNDAEFDALVVKQDEEHFVAIEMKCSHQNQPLTANQGGLYCSSHGSRFDLNGEVLNEPAILPLKKFKTEIYSEYMTVLFD